MSELTVGGLPGSQAYTWTPENKQKLGSIVFLLYSGDPAKRKQAYIDYHEFKRHFIKSVWESEFLKLENYRREEGAKTIEQMIEGVRGEITGITPNKKEGSMEGLKKIGTGLITIGEGLIQLAESGFTFGQAVPAVLESVEAPAPEEKKKAEKPKAAKKETAPAEEPATVDLVKLRDEVKQQLLSLIKIDRTKAVDLLGEFGASKLPEVSDANLQKFSEKLSEVANV